ncbi:MAG: hypothetical protein V4631_13190 [Pseudomonadota bacterium]
MTAPLVTVQPQSTSAASGSGASGAAVAFRVTATGSGTLSYQWSRNGVNLPGATSAAYTQFGVSASDSASVFRVAVSNSAGAVTSAPATLTVSGPGIYQFAGPLPALVAVTGSVDGVGQEARFRGPGGLGLDAAGNLYVADLFNYTLRKVTPAGVTSTVAGAVQVPGTVDGSALVARFAHPNLLAATSTGAVYMQDMADSVHYPIRKIAVDGTVTTMVLPLDPFETNASGAASAVTVRSFAVDAANNLYIATEANMLGKCVPPQSLTSCGGNDYVRTALRKISPTGTVTTIATTETMFGSLQIGLHPSAITADAAGNVFFSNGWGIVKVTPGGVITSLAGKLEVPGRVNGSGAAARFNWANAMTIDTQGNLFAIDGVFGEIQTVRMITPAGDVTTVAGNPAGGATTLGSLPGTLDRIHSIAVDKNGVLYLSSAGGILKIVLH